MYFGLISLLKHSSQRLVGHICVLYDILITTKGHRIQLKQSYEIYGR